MEIVLAGGQIFPRGTTVKAYSAQAFSPADIPLTGEPKPDPLTEAVVQADGTVTFEVDAGDYFAAAQVGAEWRSVRFLAPIPNATDDAIAALQTAIATIEAEVATLQEEMGEGVDLSAIEAELGEKVDESQVGSPNGVASLEAAGKVPVAQLPSAIMEYQGVWNASTNSPALADGAGNTGDTYRVSVAGNRNLGSGVIEFSVGDYVIYNGATWEKSDTTDAVASVAGKKGVVTLGFADIEGLLEAAKLAAAAVTGPKVGDLGLGRRFMGGGYYLGSVESRQPGAKKACLVPVVIPHKTKITGLVYEVGATSNGEVIGALYNSAGVRLAKSAAKAQSTAKFFQRVAFEAEPEVEPGVYWLYIVFSSATGSGEAAFNSQPWKEETLGAFEAPANFAAPTELNNSGVRVPVLSTY